MTTVFARSLTGAAIAAALLALAPAAHAIDESDLPETLRTGYVGPIIGPANDDSYAHGKLGIVRTGYGRASLYVAWRLMQLPPGAVAAESHQRVGDAFLQTRFKPWHDGPNEIDDWLRARAALVSTPIARPDFFRSTRSKIAIGHGQPDLEMTSVEGNCGADTFAFATRSLHDLVADTTLSDADRRSWIAGQDAVFARCAWIPGTSDAPALPAALPTNAPAKLKALRAYQHASALFYGGDFDAARQEFDTIAATPDQPMRAWAALGAMRAVVRPATLDKAWQAAFDDAYHRQGLRDAALYAALAPARKQHAALTDGAMADVNGRIKTIMADPAFAEVRAPAQYTARRAVTQLAPARVVGWTMDGLDHPEWNPYSGDLLRIWTQYYVLVLPDRPDPQTMTFLRKHAFYDWILTVQACGDAAHAPDEATCGTEHAHALAQWQQTKRDDWLLAALMTARQPSAADLPAATAAQAVTRDRPEWASLQFYAARVLRAQGRADDAARALAALAGAPEQLEKRDNQLVATERQALGR